ncbi:unnamed protein product [Urochloa decumbens]|uniref:Receptor kinase-like protein Xa21 n=1 Tax=Urochloa decumbens TaxID=240449 RepID=A0ABC8WB35_9POAL
MESSPFFLTLVHLVLLSSFSSLVVPAKSTTNETDLLALLSFKALISSDPFGILSSWNGSVHHCFWPGIKCSIHHPDRVTAIVLSSSRLSGQITPSLSNLTFLQELSLGDNHFTGIIPEELGQLVRLQSINLSMNSLGGNIPSTLGNCTGLRSIEMKRNNLHGTIPSTLGFCKELNYLLLYSNGLNGNIPPSLGNLTRLLLFRLDVNNLTGSIPASLGQLQVLETICLNDNNLSGEIPRSLYNISSLGIFQLAYNQLSGSLPADIGTSLPNLVGLVIFGNKLGGPIPNSLSNCSQLSSFMVTANQFTGPIPPTIGNLQNLQLFGASANLLEATTPSQWKFMDALSNCTGLQVLDLAHNQLQGFIPNSIGNLSSDLYFFSLGNNPISGSIPSEIGKLVGLTRIQLYNMQLRGTIPQEIGKLWKLEMIDVSNNTISGEIPLTFSNLTKITRLFLQNNNLVGSIPWQLSSIKALESINLSTNRLVGNIPKEIMFSSLSLALDLSNNYLNGSLPLEISKLNNVQKVILSNNKLSGEIPSTIGGCQILQVLYLDRNLFQGSLPPAFASMKALQELNLSHNSFSGQVPQFIDQMELQNLDISFNNFEGELPKGGVFKNITAVDVRGNPNLCGGRPHMHLPGCVTHCSIRPNKNPTSNDNLKFEHKMVSYNDIFKATDGFSSVNLIGKGTFGAVYKATMRYENQQTVAIKVLDLKQHGASKTFFSECEALRNIRHRNLIKVCSSCSSTDHNGNDFKALIFEFMPNGSLEKWLHTRTCTDSPFEALSLIQRMDIAIDVATALIYLHHHGTVPIVHCDLKPSNVLLDEEMVAHVGDFGLAKFLVQEGMMLSQSATSMGIKGTIGYIPPEYGMGGQASIQGDVYSYGILLLEIFTGMSPTDEMFRDGLNLPKLAEMSFPEKIMEIVDRKLMLTDVGEQEVYECLLLVTKCAILCCKESPNERISMENVAKELNSARKKLRA